MRLTNRRAQLIGEYLGIDFSVISPEQWYRGMRVELEHGPHDKKTDVTHGDLLTTAKIALAHLKEFPDYYERLERMEKRAHSYWARHEKPRVHQKARLTKPELMKKLK